MVFGHLALEFVGAGTACMYMMKRLSNSYSNSQMTDAKFHKRLLIVIGR